MARRSIRSFKPKEVENDLLMQLIRAATYAPSGGNCQPWNYFIIKDKGVIAEVVEKSCQQDWLSSAPALIVVCADIKRSEKRYGDRGKNLYVLQDTAAAIQNILLCAVSLGLGTCWCGDFNEDELAKILCVNNDMRPVAIIPVGYHDVEPVMPKRRPVDEIVTFIGESGSSSVTDEPNIRKIEHCDMGGISFNDINLGGSTFNNINFSGVNINDANLSEGQIHNCNLSNLKIYDCNLDGTTINGKNIIGLLEKK